MIPTVAALRKDENSFIMFVWDANGLYNVYSYDVGYGTNLDAFGYSTIAFGNYIDSENKLMLSYPVHMECDESGAKLADESIKTLETIINQLMLSHFNVQRAMISPVLGSPFIVYESRSVN